MTAADETLIAICRNLPPGVRFPAWAVPTRSGHLVALISEVPANPSCPWQLQQVVSAATFAALLDAGLIEHGEAELVPEYDGSRPGLGWHQGRAGWRLVVTGEGRTVAGGWLPDR
jgi:hypothetical protein